MILIKYCETIKLNIYVLEYQKSIKASEKS